MRKRSVKRQLYSPGSHTGQFTVVLHNRFIFVLISFTISTDQLLCGTNVLVLLTLKPYDLLTLPFMALELKA